MTARLIIGLALASAALAPSCRGLRQVASSATVSYVRADQDLTTSDVLGVSVTGQLEAEAFLVSIRPLAWLEPPREVIVVERPRPGDDE